jgi:hypothetical protein
MTSACLAVDQKFLQDIHPRDEDPAFYASLYEFVARLIAKKLDSTSRRLAEVERELRTLRGEEPSAKKRAAKPKAKAQAAPVKVVKAVKKVVRRPAKKAKARR